MYVHTMRAHNQGSLKFFKVFVCKTFPVCNILPALMSKDMYVRCAKKHFLKEDLCPSQVFLCALISRPVCARTHAQLRGNIAYNTCIQYMHSIHGDIKYIHTQAFSFENTRRAKSGPCRNVKAGHRRVMCGN